MSALPQIIQYGLTGLIAIIVYLAYRLFQSESSKDKPRASIIKATITYMIIGIVLAVISLVGSTIEMLTGAKHQKEVSELKQQITTLQQDAKGQGDVTKLKEQLIKATTELEQFKRDASDGQKTAQITTEVTTLKATIKDYEERSQVAKAALNRFVAGVLEQELRTTSGKLREIQEDQRQKVGCSLLRRAVFKHMLDFESDHDILRSHFIKV